jgi:glycosyltransferase involved in cell wall biosynthesis
MHIGYVLTTFPALSETFVLNEILEMERQGVTVTILSLRKPRNEPRHATLAQLRGAIVYLADDKSARPGIRELAQGAFAFAEAIARGQFSELRNISRGMRIAAGARRHGVGALHAHFADRPASLAYWAHRMTGLSFSFTAHAIDIFDHGLRDRLMTTKLATARFIVTVCEFNKRFILDNYRGASAEKIHVINNCVDLDYFSFRASETPRENHVVSVGRLAPKKGFDLLLAACARLRQSGVDVSCTIVGDGPELARSSEQARDLGVAEHVTFAGARSHEEVREFLHEATVLCLPCRRTPSGDQDAAPLVLIEAMASGVPVISARIAGVPEMIDHGENGLIVEPEDTVALAGALKELLSSPELRTRFARAARAKAEQRFSLKTNVGRVRDLMSRM